MDVWIYASFSVNDVPVYDLLLQMRVSNFIIFP